MGEHGRGWLAAGVGAMRWRLAASTFLALVACVVSAASARAESGPPVNTASPTISGIPKEGRTLALEGETLTASEGTWTGAQPISYVYRWEHCTAQGTCSSIEGPGNSYVVRTSDVGDTIQVSVTAKNSEATEGVSASSAKTAPAQANGAAVAWGENFHGQLGQLFRDNWELSPVSVNGVSGITQLAAGGADDYALLNTGELVAWGGNEAGENGDNEVLAAWEAGRSHVTVDEFNNENTNEPVALKGVKQVATADEHALAVLEDGTVKAWGMDAVGQLGDGVQGYEAQTQVNEYAARTVRWPAEPGSKQMDELTGIAAVAAGGSSDYALTKEGTVWAWGGDTVGQLGVKYADRNGAPEECHTSTARAPKYEACSEIPRKVWWTNPATGAEEELKHVKAIYAGSWAGYALLEGGALVAWGSNSDGQLGSVREGEEAAHPKRIAPRYVERQKLNEPHTTEQLGSVVEVAPGYGNVLVRLENGEILGAGIAEGGALTIAQPESKLFKAGEKFAEDNCDPTRTAKEEAKRERLRNERRQQIEGEIAVAKSNKETERVRELEKKLAKLIVRIEEGPAVKFCLKRATPLSALGSLGTEHLRAEQLSLGNSYGLALAHGKVFSWGSDARGQQGNGEEPGGIETKRGAGEGEVTPFHEYSTPTEVRGFGPAVSVEAATESHATVVLAAHSAAPKPLLAGTPVHWRNTKGEPEPAMELAWQPAAEEGGLTRISYKLSERKGEPPIAEEGTGEGMLENVMPPWIEFEGEPLEEAPAVGERLKAVAGQWNGEHPRFEYHWSRCNQAHQECVPIARWQAETGQGKEARKEHFELTDEERSALERQKPEPEWKWSPLPATLAGHTVSAGDLGRTLKVEVLATSTGGETETEASTFSKPTEVVVETAPEGGEKATNFNCKATPRPEACKSGYLITSTHVRRGKVTEIAPLVAEPYEFSFSSTEPDGNGKVRLTVVLPFGAPDVTSQPQKSKVHEGEEARFHATASGGPTPTVQWEVSSNGGASWSTVSGATSTSLVIAHAVVSQNGEQYRAVFTNSEGHVTSEAATLSVEP
jgi:alpha-tubulin suppressor-like RCC1 family protein